MAKLRYVKTPAELEAAAKLNPEFLPNSSRQVRAVYETDPEMVAAILPPPLEPTSRPEVGVTISHVSMHLAPGFDVDIGAAVFGVRTTYEGVEGLYMVTMPMTTESAVVGGRETFGEPKKLAQIEFQRTGDVVSASITRQGVTYIDLHGRVQEPLGNRRFTDYAYCFKCLPALDKKRALEFDPLLVRLEWRQQFEVSRMTGEVILRESSFDPVVDLPVRNLVSMTYEEGVSHSSGKVLRSVPAEWLVPYLHQRYDDITPMLAALAEHRTPEAVQPHA
jgi:acetoacetate decarboxylase